MSDDESLSLFSQENRILVATRILRDIQMDLLNGCYGVGRPNCETVIGVLNEPAEVLAQYKENFLRYLDQDDGPV